MNIVIDTNVVISAAMSPNGKPARIMEYVADNNDVQIFLSNAILAEYKDVLSRPQLKISNDKQAKAIDLFTREGRFVEPTKSEVSFIDESDRVFYDVTVESGAILITGNAKHYPLVSFVMSPTDFIEQIEYQPERE